ncbi:hypothetical protein [Chlamydia pneumoniae]
MKPYCKESLAYVTSKERLVSLDEDLRRAYRVSEEIPGDLPWSRK